METLFLILSIICIIGGIIGALLPSLPGPTLSYAGLLLIHFARPEKVFTLPFLITWGILTVLAVLCDYIVPLVGTKIYGASKQGLWGSVIGMLIGMVFFPPFGMIFGLLIGAICGELTAGRTSEKALKTGFVSFLSTLSTVFLKFIFCSLMAFYYVKALIRIYT